MKRITALLLAAALLLGGCAKRPQRYQHQFFDTFDTVVTLTLYAESERQADEWYRLTHERFLALHRLFDRFNEYEGLNNIASLNARAGSGPVEVSRELLDFLSGCKARYGEGDNYWRKLNIALGAVTDIWRAHIEEASASGGTLNAVAQQSQLADAALHTDPDDIIIDQAESTVSFADERLKLDVGAVAKGYAAQQAADALREAGCASFLLSAGGNVVAGDAPADGSREYWLVGIQNPAAADSPQAESILATVRLINSSMVTSGDYQRYYIAADGRRIHHIIDPDTLWPADNYRSLTIITDDSAAADALSTALFCLDYDESAAAAEDWGGAVWVFPDGSLVANARAKALLEPSAAG